MKTRKLKTLNIKMDDFMSWLNSASRTERKGRVVAGTPRSAAACPVANYLTDCGIGPAVVSGTRVIIEKDYWAQEKNHVLEETVVVERYRLPRWAVRFGKEVDKRNHLISFYLAKQLFNKVTKRP